MVLYGFAATLFAYCVSLFTPSPLAAFAAVAGYQVVIYIVCTDVEHLFHVLTYSFQLYLSGYLLTITYAKNSQAAGIITKMRSFHIFAFIITQLTTFTDFGVSVTSPVTSVVCFLAANLHFLLTDAFLHRCEPRSSLSTCFLYCVPIAKFPPTVSELW